MEGAGHERIVFHRIAKHDELGAAQAILRSGQARSLYDGATHQRHRVHVDACLGRADVDRCADALSNGECLRNRRDQGRIAARHAFLHQRGKAAEEIDPDLFRRAVQVFGHQHIRVRIRALGDQGDRRHRNAFVDDGDAVLGGNFFARAHQVLGEPADLLVGLRRRNGKIGMAAVTQADAHGDGANVEILHLHHADGFDDFLRGVTADAHARGRIRCGA